MSVVASFEIQYLQYLDAEGKLVRADLPEFAKDLKQLVELYKLMSFVRVFDTKSIALQRTGKLGTYASCLGMEAAHVAIGTLQAKSCGCSANALPRSSPPQYISTSRGFTPRWNCAPYSRYIGAKTSSSCMAEPMPTCAASWPRHEA